MKRPPSEPLFLEDLFSLAIYVSSDGPSNVWHWQRSVLRRHLHQVIHCFHQEFLIQTITNKVLRVASRNKVWYGSIRLIRVLSVYVNGCTLHFVLSFSTSSLWLSLPFISNNLIPPVPGQRCQMNQLALLISMRGPKMCIGFFWEDFNHRIAKKSSKRSESDRSVYWGQQARFST